MPATIPHNDLRKRLERTMGPEMLTPESAAFTLETIRMLSEGLPVQPSKVFKCLGWPATDETNTVDYLKNCGQIVFNDEGAIVEAAGLSLRPTRHTFRVEDTTLFTWCGIDTLFLPALIGKPADIQSVCPTTGRQIVLRVDPEHGIVSLTPQTAVVSVYVPDDGCETNSCSPNTGLAHGAKELFGRSGFFCSQVSFYSSSEAARALESRDDLEILTVTDAYDLARCVWADRLLDQAGSIGCKTI
ncbi:MAG: organomercurial lyase MerB [Rhodothermia bacterium]|nr:MAG: organomercurial lyase MerB [Rhodothermia bacterium]